MNNAAERISIRVALSDYAVWLDLITCDSIKLGWRRAFPSHPSKHRHTSTRAIQNKQSIYFAIELLDILFELRSTVLAHPKASPRFSDYLNLIPKWLLEAQQAPAVGTTALRNSSWCY